MDFIGKILSEEIISAIGWTIIHSLWQSLIVAAVLGLLLVLLQKRSAAIRYSISFTALVLIFCLSLLTFKLEYKPAEKKEFVKVEYEQEEILPGFIIENNIKNSEENYIENQFQTNFQQAMPLIVTFWMIGFLALFVKYLGGIVYALQLKNYRTTECSYFWQEKVKKLKERVALSKNIKLLESAIVKTPMVIGYIKPVILMPLGTFVSLPPDQIEAIILHELAHIKNRDYLINLCQKFFETLFFFNPVVWWVSSIINKEREYCCDDTVIGVTDNPVSLAKALNNIYIIHQPAVAQALMLTGKKTNLLGRIKRMNSGTKLKSTLFDSLLIGVILLMAVVSTTAYGNENTTAKTKSAIVDTDYGIKTYFFFKRIDGERKEFEVKTKNERILTVKMDGVKLDKDEIDEYRELIEDEIEDMDSGRKKNRKYRFNIFNESFDFDFDMDFDFDFDFDFDEMVDFENNRITINLDELDKLEDLGSLSALRSLESLQELGELEELEELKFFNSAKFEKAMKNMNFKLNDMNIKLDGLNEMLEELGERIEEAKEEMVKDGLIEDVDDDVSIKFKGRYLYIDGEKQSRTISKKYRKIFGDLEFEFDN